MLSQRELSHGPFIESGEGAALPGDVWTIEPRGTGFTARVRELWRYRQLLRYFGSRALQKLYRRTVLGRLWILIRPTFSIIVGTLIFGHLIGIQSDNVPYILFYLAGITSWELFSNCLMWVTRSLELNRKILRVMYFPRLLVPIATLAPALVHFAIHAVFIIGISVYLLVTDGKWYLCWGPDLLLAGAAVVLIVLFALGVGLWTAVWGVTARDVRFTLGYVLGFWFYLTPVIYPLSAIPERWRAFIGLNPMATLVEVFKLGILGIGKPNMSALAVAVALIAGTLSSGLWYFSKAEAASIDRL